MAREHLERGLELHARESHGGGDSAPECLDVGPPHDASADGTEPQRQHVLATLGVLQNLWARNLQVVRARS